jgi:hydrogenase-4 component F
VSAAATGGVAVSLPLPVLTLIPLFIALLGLFPRQARALPSLAAALMLAQVLVAALVCAPVLRNRTGVSLGDGFALDGVGAPFLLLTTVVAAAAAFHAALLFPAERGTAHGASDARLGMFYTLSQLFLLAMYGVLLAQNLGYLWIAMEATTLMSAPLVYFHRSRHSLEATWKYLLLCSVGIAFALFGTILIFVSSQQPGETPGTLALGELAARAPGLDARTLRLGFIFCLLGYGTKAGLFPLHNWLPDAHSEAPATASAMLSGALLNCALVALWRIGAVVTAAGQEALLRQMLVPAAAITVLAAGLMLVRQHDLKRMWAYSSVEHVGLLALSIGLGSGSLFLLHAINHSLVKTALFLLSGNILHLYGTKSLSKLSGCLRAAPATAVPLAAASFAVAGSPPFGTFLSEWLLLRDTLAAGEIAAAALVMIGLAITYVAVTCHVGRVLFGAAPASAPHAPPAKPLRPAWILAPVALLAVSLLLGTALAPPVMRALSEWMTGVG